MKRLSSALLALALLLTMLCGQALAADEPYQTLKLGDKGKAVLALKKRMYELGYFTSTNYSNEFNEVTVKRLKELQENNGLEADGIATPEVQALIFSDACISRADAPKKTPDPAASAAEGKDAPADFSDQWADRFLAEGEEPILEALSYRSSDVAIEIKTSRVNKSDVYVADVYLRRLSDLRRGFEGGEWKGKKQDWANFVELSLANDAILALTGDNSHNDGTGIVFENGVARRKSKLQRQLCVIFMDGEMRTYSSREIDMARLNKVGKGIWQTFMFGPGLLNAEGHAYKSYQSKVGYLANPRAAIGYFEPGHYCLVQVDGRGVKSLLEPGTTSVGMTMKELGDFMESLGCKAAYNLDGGQSAMIWFNDRVLSNPYKGGRGSGDIIFIPRTGTGQTN